MFDRDRPILWISAGLLVLFGMACGISPGQAKQPGECSGDEVRGHVEAFVSAVNDGDRARIRQSLSQRFQFYQAQTTPSDGFTVAGRDSAVDKLIELQADGERMSLSRVARTAFAPWSGDTGFEFELERKIGVRLISQVGKGAVECGSGAPRLVLWAMGFVTP